MAHIIGLPSHNVNPADSAGANWRHVASQPSGPTGTQAIDRAAQLLIEVVDAAEPVTAAMLTAGGGLPKSTVARLLAALERHKLVRRHRDGGFEPGEVFVRYAQSGRGDRDLAVIAKPFLDRLGKQTGETINLGVPAGTVVAQIAQTDSRYLLGGTNWLGRVVPLHCSAQGKVLLAYGSAELPPGRLEKLTAATVTSREVLLAELAGIRSAGYAVTDAELEPGLVAVAAPVCAAPGKVVAALAVSGPATRVTPERTAELAGHCAAGASALSAALGHRSPQSPSRKGAA